MPELPEVQTSVEGLQSLINKKIISIVIYTKKLRYIVPEKIIKVNKNKKILKIYRIGKYIIINLDNLYSIILHLGMSGRLKILDKSLYRHEKHDHIIFNISNKTILSFNDPRKFGFVDTSFTDKIYEKKYFKKIGKDPLNVNFDYVYLSNKINKSRVDIKQIMLNQEIIAGIGNIYASEILFDAKISPFIKGCDMKNYQIKKLIRSIKKILLNAIHHKGTSIRNYVAIDGKLGNFQNHFKVYNREGKKIGGYKIKRILQHGRSTFYCPNIQHK